MRNVLLIPAFLLGVVIAKSDLVLADEKPPDKPPVHALPRH